MHEEVLLAAVRLLPLVKTVSHNQAAPLCERLPKLGLRGGCLRSGIDRAVADLRVVGPERNQAPMGHHEFSVTVLVARPNSRHRLRGATL